MGKEASFRTASRTGPHTLEKGPDQFSDRQVFNLAATRPDLLTGVDPATGQPAPYGSVGVDINCAVIGYTAKAPTANLAGSSIRGAAGRLSAGELSARTVIGLPSA